MFPHRSFAAVDSKCFKSKRHGFPEVLLHSILTVLGQPTIFPIDLYHLILKVLSDIIVVSCWLTACYQNDLDQIIVVLHVSLHVFGHLILNFLGQLCVLSF